MSVRSRIASSLTKTSEKVAETAICIPAWLKSGEGSTTFVSFKGLVCNRGLEGEGQ